MLLIALGLLILFGAASVAAGETTILSFPVFWKGVALFVGYVVSIYAVGSVPGKSRHRKLLSWAFSAVFHSGIVAYVGLVLKFGVLALVVLMAEIAAALLSIAGLGLTVAKERLTP